MSTGSCTNKDQDRAPAASDTSAQATSLQNANTENNGPADTVLMSLKKFKDQYPSDAKLLDQPEIKSRLELLLGKDYDNFRKYWQTETPIKIEGNVLSTTGCEQHNCGANQYVLQIDLMHNNINVYHFGQNIQSYLEKGPINLPSGLAKEFQNISGNNSI
ncbi:MAG TPA: hypothetical protein VFL76_10000 [Edaphocola sp.]|nr:hypothetical protein [Edaphocola sp.]